MAVVIPIQDIVRARRRSAERECTERCIELLQANLRLALDAFDAAGPSERPLWSRRIRNLGALLEYAVNVP
jgi:hypothetical protein